MHDAHPITFLTTRFWPDRHGGVEQRMWHVTRALAARGVGVSVLCENRTNAPEHQHVDGVSVRRGDPLTFGRLWRWRELLRVRWWHRLLRRHDCPGLVWATDPMAAAAAVLAGLSHRLIFNPACSVAAQDDCGRVYDDAHLRCSRTMRLLDRLSYRSARHIVVSSHILARQFRRRYGRRDDLHVVSHGAPEVTHPDRAAARAALRIDPAVPLVGFVGRLDQCKDLPFSFAALARCHPSVQMLVVGEGPHRSRLTAAAAACGIAHRLQWTGATADPSIAYAAMDALVLPSYCEAFGNVILEAMAAGVPVIGRHCSEHHPRPVLTACDEIIEDQVTGRLVGSHDHDELAAVFNDLTQHRDRWRTMGDHARRHAARHTWRHTVDRYCDVLRLGVAQRLTTMNRAA